MILLASKNTDIIEQLADTICGNLVATSTKNGKETAPNDKTYPSIIIGVNRKFTDNVSEDEQSEIIEKFSIPESVEEGENNYYIFKINGVYYCKSQNGDFKLYDKIMVYIPNGIWSNMYFDYADGISHNSGSSQDIELPRVIFSVDEPGDSPDIGDVWILVNDSSITEFKDITTDNYIHSYIYSVDEDTGISKWIKTKIVLSSISPSLPEQGDYWFEIDDDNKLIAINICTQVSGSLVTWSEIYPESEIEDTIKVIITTDVPMTIGDYWLKLDAENTKNIQSAYKYEIDEETSSEKWILQGNFGSGSGNVYINISHAILIQKEDVV